MTPYEADTLFESTDDKSQIFPKAKIGLQTCVENHGLAVLKVDSMYYKFPAKIEMDFIQILAIR